MNQEIVTVRNLDTGRVSEVRRKIAEHPLFGQRLEIVPAGSKKLVRLENVPAIFSPVMEEEELNEEDYE